MVGTIKDSQRLVKYGFIKSSAKEHYSYNEKKGYYTLKAKKPDITEYSESHADEEEDEEANISSTERYFKTGFPKPTRRYRMVYEAFNLSLEEMYFWSINHIRQDAGYPHMVKVTDMFSASENSAFFGQAAQRLSIQEDRASSFLRGISELIKTLFQIVRELRIIDERLDVYKEWTTSKSADATLKGLFADFAENKGGQPQPGSLYYLSTQLGYAVLPDLFFNTYVYKKDELDKIVNALGFNQNVKTVLKRKLYQFLIWVEKTEQELKAKRKFQIKYLRQHYLTIKMYMIWVKPYLKHIKRLTMNEEMLDSPELISSFETSTTEIEVIAYKPTSGGMNACVLMSFDFSTRPIMQYSQEYNRGPVHVGRGVMTLRTYGWTDEQIRLYKKMRDNEDYELLGLVDEQLKSAIELLGDDLQNYISEAQGTLEEDKAEKAAEAQKKEKLQKVEASGTIYDPFVDIFKGFWDIGKMLVPAGMLDKNKPKPKGDSKAAAKAANSAAWLVFKNFKKSHGMLSW